MSNFLFLKKKNAALFKIIAEAEKLFRDEYFEQVMVQTRKFAENLCKDLLENHVSKDDTFDNIINKIKDNSFENVRMQELVNDLYFIKKNGNESAHSLNSSKVGEIALECLECAFEISIFYSHVKFGFDEKLDKTSFSEELLMTGKQTKTKKLKDKYVEVLNNERNNNERVISTVKTNSKNKNKSKNKIHKKKALKSVQKITRKVSVPHNNTNIVKVIFIVLLLLVVVVAGLLVKKFWF